jgi:hypothetical protein
VKEHGSGPSLAGSADATSTPAEAGSVPAPAARLGGRLLLGAASVTLVAVSVPVMLRGAPLADDFNNCLAPQDMGLAGFMSASFERLGLIRPARFVEILLTTGVCQNLPFGVAIVVGLSLTFVVAFLLRRLLTMLGSPAPWPDVAAALWLLQPLGLEAALWPAALHVPIGLAAALGSLIAHRSRHLWMGVLLGLVAMLSLEQAILALPLAAWLVSPAESRRRAVIAMTAVAVTVVVAYLLVPGSDPRLSADATDRARGLFNDIDFFVRFPAAGIGAESIPLAVRWAFPVSVVVLVAGAVAGWLWGSRVWPASPPTVRPSNIRTLITVALLIVLVNVPVLLSQPRQGSPRIFTPTWLVLAAVAGLWLGRASWNGRRVAAALAGLYLSGAVLSLALSAWVRMETADVVEQVSREIAERTADGDLVTLCEVPRAVMAPAPRGAFAVQDYIYDWAAEDALRYYTDRRATFRIHLADGGQGCPEGDADLAVPFEALRDVDG